MFFSRVAFCLIFTPFMASFAHSAVDAVEGDAMLDFVIQFPMLGVMLYVWNSTRKDHKELMNKLIDRQEKTEAALRRIEVKIGQ